MPEKPAPAAGRRSESWTPDDAVKHVGYPQDGHLRWVRWIDKVVAGSGTGSPYAHVLLSQPLDSGDPARPLTPEQAIFAGRDDVGTLVPVHVGDMPALSPGLLVRDGKRVGWLDMEERTFDFDRNTASDPIARWRESPAEKPAFWSSDIPWTVLPTSNYPLSGSLKHSCCVVIHDGACQLVLPCSEVFRFFYAPETRVADVLLRAPFDTVKDRVLNPEWTGPRSDGSFQVGLRSGLTGRSAASLANLALGGRAAAGQLRLMMMPGGREAPTDPEEAGVIEVGIPYDWTRMHIRVRGLQIYPELRRRGTLDKFLGMVIVGVAWPVLPRGVPSQVHYRLDNNNVAPDGDGPPPDPPRPVGPRGVPVAAEGGDLQETAADPPGIGTETTFVAVPTALVEGGLEVVRMPPEVCRLPRRSQVVTSPEDVDRVSSAEQQSGSPGVGTLRYVQGEAGEEDGAPRFAALAERLEELRAERLIESWTPLDPGGAMRAVREGMPVWPFPGFDPARGMTRRALPWSSLFPGIHCARTALVAEISVEGRTAHWLEIELRAGEAGYRSVVFTAEGPAAGVVPSILLTIARAGGMAPSVGAAFASLPNVSTAVRRRHGPGDDPFKGRRRRAMTHDAYVLLDANILLHFRPPNQIDWPALSGARRVWSRSGRTSPVSGSTGAAPAMPEQFLHDGFAGVALTPRTASRLTPWGASADLPWSNPVRCCMVLAGRMARTAGGKPRSQASRLNRVVLCIEVPIKVASIRRWPVGPAPPSNRGPGAPVGALGGAALGCRRIRRVRTTRRHPPAAPVEVGSARCRGEVVRRGGPALLAPCGRHGRERPAQAGPDRDQGRWRAPDLAAVDEPPAVLAGQALPTRSGALQRGMRPAQEAAPVEGLQVGVRPGQRPAGLVRRRLGVEGPAQQHVAGGRPGVDRAAGCLVLQQVHPAVPGPVFIDPDQHPTGIGLHHPLHLLCGPGPCPPWGDHGGNRAEALRDLLPAWRPSVRGRQRRPGSPRA